MTITRAYLLLIAALVCAVISLVVALGADLGGSTWQEWISGALTAYFGSQVP